MGVVYWNAHETVKCPAGAVARHAVHGWVTVVDAQGWSRTIESYHYESGDESRGTARAIRRCVHVVDVRDLHLLPALDP